MKLIRMRRSIWLTVTMISASVLIVWYLQWGRYPVTMFHHPLLTLTYPAQYGDGIPVLSPDNHTLAILIEPKQSPQSDDFTAIMMDAETGGERREFRHLGVRGFFTDDGAYFDSLGPVGFMQCDLKTGTEKRLVHTTGTYQALSHNLHFLLLNENDFLTLYDTRTGKLLRRFSGKGNWAGTAISWDDKWLAVSSSDGSDVVQVYAIDTGLEAAHILTPTDRDARVAFSRDGTRLATVCDHQPVTLWETTQWTKVKQLPVEDYTQVWNMYFSVNNMLIVGGQLGENRRNVNEIWSANTSRRILEASGVFLAISLDGRRAAAAGSLQENGFGVYSLQSGRKLFQFERNKGLQSYQGPQLYPCFSYDGTLLVECADDNPATYLVWRVPR